MTITEETRWKWGVAAFVAGALALMVCLSDSLFPLFIAFGLAYAFSPIVDRLEKRGLSRTVAVLGILGLLVGLFALLIGTVVPLLVNQIQGFIEDFPKLLPVALKRVSDFAAGFGIVIPGNVDALADRARSTLQKGSMQSLNPVVNAAKHFFSSVAGVLLAFLNLVIVPIFFFYVCRDFHRSRAHVFRLIPPRQQPYARTLFHRIDEVLSGYIRGQLLVAGILSVIFAVALVLLNVRFGLFIGILAGFLNIVPYLGQITGLVLALVMALVDFEGFGKIIGVLGVFAAANFVEGNFITPKIVGNKVGLSPLWAILALIVGGKAAGFVGMIIAVPLAGVLKVLFGEILLKYKSSGFYLDPKPHSVTKAENT